MFYKMCRHCGSHLDPGERCDCQEEANKYKELMERLLTVESDGQYRIGEELCLVGK